MAIRVNLPSVQDEILAAFRASEGGRYSFEYAWPETIDGEPWAVAADGRAMVRIRGHSPAASLVAPAGFEGSYPKSSDVVPNLAECDRIGRIVHFPPDVMLAARFAKSDEHIGGVSLPCSGGSSRVYLNGMFAAVAYALDCELWTLAPNKPVFGRSLLLPDVELIMMPFNAGEGESVYCCETMSRDKYAKFRPIFNLTIGKVKIAHRVADASMAKVSATGVEPVVVPAEPVAAVA